MDLKDIYRSFHPNTKDYTFSAPHRTPSKTNHIVRHKTSLNRCKKTEITLKHIVLNNLHWKDSLTCKTQ